MGTTYAYPFTHFPLQSRISEIAISASRDYTGNPESDFTQPTPQSGVDGFEAGAVYIFSAAPESYFPPPVPPTVQLAKAKKLAKALTTATNLKKAKKTYNSLIALLTETLNSTVQSTVAGQKIYNMAGVIVQQNGKKITLKLLKKIGKQLLSAAK